MAIDEGWMLIHPGTAYLAAVWTPPKNVWCPQCNGRIGTLMELWDRLDISCPHCHYSEAVKYA